MLKNSTLNFLFDIFHRLIYCLIINLCIVSVLYSAYSSADTLAPSLHIVTENLPPYQIVKHQELVGGTSYLIMKEMIKRTGFITQFEVLPWARAYHTALNDSNVIIFSMTRSAEREQSFKWIGRLRELKYSFYSVKTNQSLLFSNAAEAKRYTVVVVRNSFEAESLIKQGFVVGKNLIFATDYSHAWQMLAKGRADLTYANAYIADNVSEHFSFSPNTFIKQPFEVEVLELYVAASLKTSDDIVTKLKEALEGIKSDGTFYQITSPFIK